MPNVLVVDDESLMRWSLRKRMEDAGHAVVEAATGAEALQRFREGTDVVLLDYRLPDTNGRALIKQLKAIDPEPPVILLTAHASIEHAVDAMQEGAYYYAQKTVDLDNVPVLVERALESTRLNRELRTLLARERAAYGLGNLIGASDSIRAVKVLVHRVAEKATTVLLAGESGTGKDLVARAIHAESGRAGGPFMNITCSALPESLLENELFGHERGAFTDAQRQKSGLLEQANGGTVFLDEIGDVSLGVQAKLLRFLEEKVFRRLGGVSDVRPDVRVIAATNRDLRQAVREGRFREDLLYRLSVVDIELPPLRDRKGDVEILAKYFVDRFNKEFRTKVTGVTSRALGMLDAHWWPGNVRELRNTMERAMLLHDCEVLDVDHFKIAEPVRAEHRPYDLPVDGIDFRDLERELIKTALERTQGNQSRAAALLHMTRDQIRHRMAKFDLVVRVDDVDAEAS
jgi:two-component system, NtrC family, response regulator AtoC